MNAATISQMVPSAKPLRASLKLRVPVTAQRAMPVMATAPMGSG